MTNRKDKIRFSHIDLKILNVLTTNNKELTLNEIANETGERPQNISKSLWKLFVID